MEQPLVSVIIPVYNAKNHIARCIESVCKQTYQNLEILLLNDGSRDVSPEVCRMYADRDSRITLVNKPNSGVSATRNLGLAMAKGEYLQFVDSDDYLAPSATALLVQKALTHDADMVIAHYYRVEYPYGGDPAADEPPRSGPDPAPVVTPLGFLPEGFLDKRGFAENLMAEPASFYYGVMWNKLYRRKIVAEHEIHCSEELTWSEDFLFNLEFIRYAERFYSLASPIYYYVRNPESICSTKINLHNLVTTKAALFSYYKELYEEMGLYEANKLQIYKYLVASAEA